MTPLEKIIQRAESGIEIHKKQINLGSNSSIVKNRHSYLINVCKAFKEMASELLEEEKQNIINAHDAYRNIFGTCETGEEYYQRTFKNK